MMVMKSDSELNDVNRVVTELFQIREALVKGELFDSLPEKIDDVLETIPFKKRRTKLKPFTDSPQLSASIQKLEQRLMSADSETKLTDAELDQLIMAGTGADPRASEQPVFHLFLQIFKQQLLTEPQLNRLKYQLMSDDDLFYHILEPESDAAFTRSFSLLVMARVFQIDRTAYHLFSDDDLIGLSLRIAAFALMERDRRSFEPDVGWINVFVHAMAVWSELNENDQLQRADKLMLMTTFLAAYRYCPDSLIYGEDAYLTSVIAQLVQKNSLYEQYFLIYMQSWQEEVTDLDIDNDDITFWNRWYNRKRLLQSLLLVPEMPKSITVYLSKIADIF